MLTSHLYSRTLTVMCVAAPFDTVEITNGYGYELTAVPCLPTITRPGHRCASFQLCRARSSPASMFVRVCQSELLSVWRRTPREKKKRRPGEIGARPFCNNGGLSYKMAAQAKIQKSHPWSPVVVFGGTIMTMVLTLAMITMVLMMLTRMMRMVRVMMLLHWQN